MKRLTHFLLVLVGTLAIFCLTSASCGSGSNDPSPSSSSYLTCSIDGKAWASTSQMAQSSSAGNAVVITATTQDATLVQITLHGNQLQTGKALHLNPYTSNDDPAGLANYVSGGNAYIGESKDYAGVITLSEFSSTHVAGTFSFNAMYVKPGTLGSDQVVQIREGKFSIPITK